MGPKKKKGGKKEKKGGDDEGEGKKNLKEPPPPIVIAYPQLVRYKGLFENESSRPSCLDAIMQRVSDKEFLRRGAQERRSHRAGVTARCANGLFMPQVDFEAVASVLQPVDLEAILQAEDRVLAEQAQKTSARHSAAGSDQAAEGAWRELRLSEDGNVATAIAGTEATSARRVVHAAPRSPSRLQQARRESQDDESLSVTLPSLRGLNNASSSSSSSIGAQTLPLETAQKYFGNAARREFFDQYQKMFKQSKSFAPDARLRLLNDPSRQAGAFWIGSLAAKEIVPAAAVAASMRPSSPTASSPTSPGGSLTRGRGPEAEEDHEELAHWSEDVYLYNQRLDTVDRRLLAGHARQHYGPGGELADNATRSVRFETNRGMYGATASLAGLMPLPAGASRTGHDTEGGSGESGATPLSKMRLHLDSLGLDHNPVHALSLAALRGRRSTAGLGGVEGGESVIEVGGGIEAEPSVLTVDGSMSYPVKSMPGFDPAFSARSPRTAYIAACIDNNVAPLPKVILRKALSTVVDLAHYCMGDVLGCALADSIAALPSIESINLRENNLTDVALEPLLLALARCPHVLELDISENKVDAKAAGALALLLAAPGCALQRLTLDNSDVDDQECLKFVACLEANQSLLTLDLSNNLLGSHELVHGATTGGEALAAFLNAPQCRLHTLSLAWNKIRHKSAMHLASALATNTTLTHLDLSYNGLGTMAGEVLGASLLDNTRLETLLLKSSSINATACISICVGVSQNASMRHLCIDLNPIGSMGARAVMGLPMLIGERVRVSAASCNTHLKDASCFYDPSNAVGDYKLDLSLPFHRAVAFSVLQTVSLHSTCVIARASYQAAAEGRARGSFGREEKLDLVQSIATDREEQFDESQRAVLQSLRLLEAAASDVQRATALYYEADLDKSGELDREELRLVLARLGIDAATNPKRLADIMSLFDLDGSGLMNLPDFLSLVKSQRVEAEKRIREMTTRSVMSLASKPGVRYIPPRTGQLNLSVVDGYMAKQGHAVMTDGAQRSTLNLAQAMGDVDLLNAAIKNARLHTQEAYDLFRSLYKDSGKLLPSLAQILPQMESAAEAKRLLSLVTHDDDEVLAHVQAYLGPTIGRVAFGSINGYYLLDLSVEMHRSCLSRLLELSAEMNGVRNRYKSLAGSGSLGDASQHGNWTCFRNEVLNHCSIELTAATFGSMPHAGILEFDFVSFVTLQGGEVWLTNARFCKVLSNLHLLRSADEVAKAMQALDVASREPKYFRPVVSGSSVENRLQARRTDGFMSTHECDAPRAREMHAARRHFYAALLGRKAQMREALAKEKRGAAWVKKMIMARGTAVLPAVGEGQGEGLHGHENEHHENEHEEEHDHEEAHEDEQDNHHHDHDGALHAALASRPVPPPLSHPAHPASHHSHHPQHPHPQHTRQHALEQQRRHLRQLQELDPDVDLRSDGPSGGGGSTRASAAPSGLPSQQPSPLGSPVPVGRKSLPASPGRPSFRLVDSSKTKTPMSPAATIALAASKAAAMAARRDQVDRHRASRYHETIVDTFSSVWIKSRQLALLVRLLAPVGGGIERTASFGSYAVEVVVALFSKVVDINNIELVLRELPPRCAGILQCRLGLLSLFSPVKPEGSLRLSLAVREERRALKLLLYLAGLEGRQALAVRYREGGEEDPAEEEGKERGTGSKPVPAGAGSIPEEQPPRADGSYSDSAEYSATTGTSASPPAAASSLHAAQAPAPTEDDEDGPLLQPLPPAWLSDKTLPHAGTATLTYTSGAVKGQGRLQDGFRPHRLMRRALTHVCLVDEFSVDVDEEDDDDLRTYLAKHGRGIVDSVGNKTLPEAVGAWSSFLLL